MKKNFKTRIIAVLSAMTMAVTMMVTSASAATWSVYKRHNTQGKLELSTTSSTYLQTTSTTGIKTCKVNCSTFSVPNPSATNPPPYVEYWTYVSTDASGSSSNTIGLGFSRQTFYDQHKEYIPKSLSTAVSYGKYLQCRAELLDYTYVADCTMSGNFIW